MKIKKFSVGIIAFVSAFIISALIICSATGCLSSAAKRLEGSWTLTLAQSSRDTGKYVKSATLKFENRNAYFDVECVEGYRCNMDSHYLFDGEGNDNLHFNGNNVTGFLGYCSFRLEGEYLYVDSVQLENYGGEGDYDFVDVALGFKKVNSNPSNPPEPSKPEKTKFEDIKTAYKNAGYSVDVGLESVDPTLSATLKQIRDLYKQYGCAVTYIGKNLNDAMSMELYMLIAAGNEDNAREYESSFNTSYSGKVRRSGVDIIVSVSLFGSPNFTPFESATA